MPTFTALTTLSDAGNAHALGEAMESMQPEPTGVGVFEMEDGSGLWEVGGYFLEAPDATALAILSAAFGAAEFTVSELPETDWVAKVRRELAPVQAGDFFVYGSHDADKVPEGSIPLLIEASMAFGTGHHGTTLGCLRAINTVVGQGHRPARVLDLGCGTAVLAMAAVKVWPEAQVLASDIDSVAVEVSEANLTANDMAGTVAVYEATGLDHPALAEAAPFDLILANILKGPLVLLAPSIRDSVAPGGIAILSGILNPQADEVIEVYVQNGFNLAQRTEIVDWTTLILHRN